MVLVITGVSGVGKTTVGRLLAAQLGWRFADADDWHPAAWRACGGACRSRRPTGRPGWRRCAIAGWLAAGQDVVLACSALRAAHRRALTPAGGGVRFVHLRADTAIIAARLGGRRGHFMPPALLASQLATLEEPTEGVVVDASPPPGEVVRAIRARLGL